MALSKIDLDRKRLIHDKQLLARAVQSVPVQPYSRNMAAPSSGPIREPILMTK